MSDSAGNDFYACAGIADFFPDTRGNVLMNVGITFDVQVKFPSPVILQDWSGSMLLLSPLDILFTVAPRFAVVSPAVFVADFDCTYQRDERIFGSRGAPEIYISP
ncbi:MAG: hypothetical protein WAN11_23785 [Syntrophobacteraceae bacterium]